MIFNNPVLPGFHPDPSVCRVGHDYYLATSSFQYFPGVPIHHSRDLVHWRLIGHCLMRPSQVDLAHASNAGGIFAPTLRYHQGTFYMITTNVTQKWNFFVSAADPAGPWSEPVRVDREGYDPSLFFDEDGQVYYTRWGAGNQIVQAKIDVRNGRLDHPPRSIWSGSGAGHPEGPHLFKAHGYYYLMAAEGGTHLGHTETIARARTPLGPFENCPHNPILTHRHDNTIPIQAVGHADLIKAHDGTWWALFLGFRPQLHGFFPFHHLGRETYLAPVHWTDDGWPLINGRKTIELEMEGPAFQAAAESVPTRDDFDSPQLGLCWNFLRGSLDVRALLQERPGWLRLRGSALTLDSDLTPQFTGRRQEHFCCRAAACLDFAPRRENEHAGLTVYADAQHHYELTVSLADGRRALTLFRRIGDLTARVATQELPEGLVVLEIESTRAEYRFSWSTAGQPARFLASASTRYLATEVVGGFTGVYLGMYATGNGVESQVPADFDWFDYEGKD